MPPSRTPYAIFAGLVLVIACGGDDVPWDASAPLTDPMVVAVDALAPANGFDGTGSLALGAGWGIPQGDGSGTPWGSVAWVVGTEARVHVALARQAGQVDLFGRCLPYPWEAGSPLQTWTLEAAGSTVARVEMARDWSSFRVPLPETLPREALVDLRLVFDHALRPPHDSRELAAACTELAVVPRRIGDVGSFLAAHAFDPSGRRVTLPVGGGLRLLLPPAYRGRVRLADLRLDCRSCRLVLELDEPGSPTRHLATAARPGREARETVFAGTDGRGSLTLRAESTEAEAEGVVAFTIEEVAVQRRRRPAAPAPSVYVYAVDTLRADALEAGLDRTSSMPSALALAERGVTYSQARAPSSWTLPSVVSLLTGLYPDLHGVRTGGEGRALDRLPTLARALGRRGYRTVAISHSVVVGPSYGVDAGFDAFYVSDQLNGRELRSQEARGLLARWLAGDGRRPELVYVHTVDPHAPYSSPEAGAAGRPDLLTAGASPAQIARLRELYVAEVKHADRELGRFLALLAWLDVFDASFVVLVADHGEELGEHGGLEHGKTLYDEVLRVPLIVKYPRGRWAGERVTEPVSLVGLAPTFLAASSSGPSPVLDGRSLPVPGEAPRRAALYFEVAPYRDPGSAPVDLRGWTDGRDKCIEDRAPSSGGSHVLVAFDLARDPGEQQALGPAAETAKRCREWVAAWDRLRAAAAPSAERPSEDSREALERLRSLGYLD